MSKKHENCGYQIVERESKYGLSYNQIPLLEPIYSSVEVLNEYSHEHTLGDFKDNRAVVEVNEYNFPIVIADGKYGLLNRNELKLGLDYVRIIKLSFCHYLCQKDSSNFVLYDVSNISEPLAIFTAFGELNLDNLLQILQSEHPKAYTELRKRIHQKGNKYISEYRLYDGVEVVGNSTYHDFDVATIKVELNNDLQTSQI